MSETLPIRLTCAQRLAASDLLPELSARLLLDSKNERTIQLTQTQLGKLRDAATRSLRQAPSGVVRNSLQHIIDKATDVLTRESAAQHIIRLKITLIGRDPPIWRRVETTDCSLAQLHDIIQAAMGWEDYHLHRFQVGQRQYGNPDPMDRDFGIHLIDERKVKLSEVIAGAGQRVKVRVRVRLRRWLAARDQAGRDRCSGTGSRSTRDAPQAYAPVPRKMLAASGATRSF